jgi:RNA polymerase-interacting CarD/CdnL/TRCF family regulator
MAEESIKFAEGDWIVHLYHGVGQVISIESKSLDGNKVKYYKVQTKDSIYWVPVGKVDEERIRPLSTPKEIDKALRIIRRKPRQMSADHMKRKNQINDVRSIGALDEVAKIIRDLYARQVAEKLNDSEERALSQFTDRLLSEWSVSKDISTDEARQILTDILQKYEA